MVRLALALVMVVAPALSFREARAGERKVVRVAVIGGMVMTGLWQKVSAMFENQTGLKIELVATGERPRLAEVFRKGQADLLTMHSGDITTDLVADGYGVNMRPWARNDLVIVGPSSDPAGVRGLRNGAEAFKRIAERRAPFVDFRGIGSREMCHRLWKAAGVVPRGDWVLKDESEGHLGIVSFAASKGAYVVVGRMPVLFGKLKAERMEILVEGDLAMRRPYVVMEANPRKFPGANHEGARRLSDFLLSPRVQRFLATFRAAEFGGIPLFHPVASEAWSAEE